MAFMTYLSRFATYAILSVMFLSNTVGAEQASQRILVFRVAHGQATHFSISCGPTGLKEPANLLIILTAINRRPPNPYSTVTVAVDGAKTVLSTNQRGLFYWESADFKDSVSVLLERLKAAKSMNLQFEGGPAVDFDLEGAWLDSPRACVGVGKPETVTMLEENRFPEHAV